MITSLSTLTSFLSLTDYIFYLPKSNPKANTSPQSIPIHNSHVHLCPSSTTYISHQTMTNPMNNTSPQLIPVSNSPDDPSLIFSFFIDHSQGIVSASPSTISLPSGSYPSPVLSPLP